MSVDRLRPILLRRIPEDLDSLQRLIDTIEYGASHMSLDRLRAITERLRRIPGSPLGFAQGKPVDGDESATPLDLPRSLDLCSEVLRRLPEDLDSLETMVDQLEEISAELVAIRDNLGLR